MKLRAPSVPIITVSPYFTIWSPSDKLFESETVHWTSQNNTLRGKIQIDDIWYRFMGLGREPSMKQSELSITSAETCYVFEAAGVRLFLSFFTPQIINNFEWMSRPISFLKAHCESTDGKDHAVTLSIAASEELCLETKGTKEIETEIIEPISRIKMAKMGAKVQHVLAKAGDETRIDWGYFYLSVQGKNTIVQPTTIGDMTAVEATADISSKSALFVFAYDDIDSFLYFGKKIKAYWKKDGDDILDVVSLGFSKYNSLIKKARAFAQKLFDDAKEAGGEEYAELCALAYRQVLAAHKLAADSEGNILYVSKECRSGGFGCTVDVSYPSTPLFLLYNPKLIEGMLTPVFRYAKSKDWKYDFAPHDVGIYPHINGQMYGKGEKDELSFQMPIEECGNMLIMSAALLKFGKNKDYLKPHFLLLKKWANYLIEHGVDPNNQLCTDDFAGHLAHNCNLSLKAIMALRCMAFICDLLGEKGGSYYLEAALAMTKIWRENALNEDGSYRLAFDCPGSFSMKYNLIWDDVFWFGLFEDELKQSEFHSYKNKINAYGLPLDNRADYTKSDWLLWTASFAKTKEEFASFIKPMWQAYNDTTDRVPMTDWYDTKTAKQVGFQHRTVQGGLFMKLLLEKEKQNG